MEIKNEQGVAVEVTEQEWQLIQLLRQLDYGELVIDVKKNMPYRAELRQSIQIK